MKSLWWSKAFCPSTPLYPGLVAGCAAARPPGSIPCDTFPVFFCDTRLARICRPRPRKGDGRLDRRNRLDGMGFPACPLRSHPPEPLSGSARVWRDSPKPPLRETDAFFFESQRIRLRLTLPSGLETSVPFRNFQTLARSSILARKPAR